MTKQMQRLMENGKSLPLAPDNYYLHIFNDYDGVNLYTNLGYNSVSYVFMSPTQAEELAAFLLLKASEWRKTNNVESLRSLEETRHAYERTNARSA